MAYSITMGSGSSLKTWPRVMLQQETGDIWIVNYIERLNKYPCYITNEGNVVMRDDINDLIALSEGTTFTVTNR